MNKARRALLGLAITGGLLAGGLTFGAAPSQAHHNFCDNGSTDDVWIDAAQLGVDAGLSPLGHFYLCSGYTSVGGQVIVTTSPAGQATGRIIYCPFDTYSCYDLVGETGVKQARPPRVSILPYEVDTGYDLYIDGTNRGPILLSINAVGA